jgi:AraC-like DNA-binding protein
MNTAMMYAVNPGWRVILNDLGLSPADILRRAGLPGDLFGRAKAALHTDEYFRLWEAIADEAADPLLPLRVAETITLEAFDPPLFAAMCSPDLNTALGRIAQYKRLIAPMALHLDRSDRSTRLEIEWLDKSRVPPAIFVATELAFFTRVARIGTRAKVVPREVRAPVNLGPEKDVSAFFGVRPKKGKAVSITFTAADAARSFLTSNAKMWDYFEPGLKHNLAELNATATHAERVQAALLELIPAGMASIESAAKKLGTSTRTLQRKLRGEGSSFQAMLNETRKDLALHYLQTSRMSGAEISFLLGFEDPNSFFRAFRGWTGETPERFRTPLH